MIKTLLIKNLILIEKTEITFDAGLTVVTGETGAGKTAFVQALRLIMGERADASKVRNGCEKAFIQATIDLPQKEEIASILQEAGIEYSGEEEFIICREISASGKSRALILGQLVPLAIIQKLAPHLIEFISQHEQITLKNGESQRKILDIYSGVDLSLFQNLWNEEKERESELEHLRNEAARSQKGAIAEKLEELVKLNLQENEEELLFEEYTLLSNSQEIQANSAEILELSDEAATLCVKMDSLVSGILKYTNTVEEGKKMSKEALFQIAELRNLMQSFFSKIEMDPHRLDYLEHRLQKIDKLKKLYGKDLLAVQTSLKQQLERLENSDEIIRAKEEELKEARKKTSKEAENITRKRELGAKSLEKALSSALQSLNIPSAEFRIKIEKQTRTTNGEEGIDFYLKANRGELPVPVRDSTSGGELSRLLFAIKVILAEKKAPTTMIFDEIDANVGGKTGAVMGQELAKLSKTTQVFCITHFPQVARYGNHHFRVVKEETFDRTTCTIEPLKPREREKELLRMLGGEQPLTEATSK